jgi:uncharacterized membrane protein YkoI
LEKLNVVLIIVIIVLVGMLGTAFGYMFLTNNKNGNNITSNQTQGNETNITNQTGNKIPYSPEYITFSKAKSIAKSHAAKGVVTSDPILVKAKNGDAIYYSDYSYNGVIIGGIIINAKTGSILGIQQNIPNTTTTTNDNTNYDNNYDNTNSGYDNSNYDNSYDNSNNYQEPSQDNYSTSG